MTERLAIVGAVLIVSATLAVIGKWYLAWHRSRAVLPLVAPGSEATGPGLPTLIYLHTSDCSLCGQQAKIVDAIEVQHSPDLRVLRVDALSDSALSDRYGVWTVPATIVADAAGNTVAVNCGLASAAKLARQVAIARQADAPGQALMSSVATPTS